jgi:hypothetical protein
MYDNASSKEKETLIKYHLPSNIQGINGEEDSEVDTYEALDILLSEFIVDDNYWPSKSKQFFSS